MTVENLESEKDLKKLISKGTTILMIHKTSCPFCEKADPWLEEFAEEFDQITIAKINKNDLPTLLDSFNLVSYPTFVAIKNGKILDMFYGNTQYDLVKEFVEKATKA